jgi:hypothetical protein
MGLINEAKAVKSASTSKRGAVEYTGVKYATLGTRLTSGITIVNRRIRPMTSSCLHDPVRRID